MVAEKGKAFLIKIGDGQASETFTVIGGMRSTSFKINNEIIDATHKQSGGWRELLPGAGIRHVSLSGSGIFTNSDAEKKLQAKAMTSSVDHYEIIFESGDKFEGSFQVTHLEYSGDYNGERSYNMAFESSGPVVFTSV
jgi:TP901-1 family phage major tail protein